MTGAVDESGSTTLTYYQDGNFATVVRRVGAISLASAYKYDLAGRLVQITYLSGRVLILSYIKGKVVGLTFANQQILSNIKYHPFGALSEWTWGNGKSYSRKYNLNGEIESYDQAGSVKTVHRDAAGRIIEIGDNLRADLIQSFKYDNFDHLSEYRVGSSAALERKFTYDVEGNRKTVELAGKVFTYTYAPGTNYLVSAPGPVARQWAVLDANAKTFTDGTNVFTLDSYRRISSVKNAKGITTYLRDYTGRRVSKKFSDGSAVHYVHDADGHLIAEVDGAGATLVEYIWLDDMPVAVLQNGVLYYVYTDHLNTPRAVTDTANTIRWTWHSEPFGSSFPNESPSGVAAFKLNLRFPGQYYDVESGLHYNYFRDYDPQTGRYVQSDPIGLEGGINTYAYVEGNPVSGIDPTGLFNPVKGTVSLVNSTRGVYQILSGVASMATRTVPGVALGVWRLNSGISSMKRAKQQWGEALCEKTSDASVKNLWGLAPFGQNIDDPNEPSAIDFYKNLPAQKMGHWWEILKEIGTQF